MLSDLADRGAQYLYDQYLYEKLPFYFATLLIRQHFHNLQGFYSNYDH